MKKKWLGTAAAVALSVALGTASASAIELNFDQLSDGGTLSYNGTGGPLVGTNIVFQQVTGIGTPLENGTVLTCSPDCTLNFTTGNNTVETATGYVWAGGGTFTLTGTLFDGATEIASGTLLTGTFTGTLLSPGGSLSGAQFGFLGLGTDSKDPDLLAFFGLTGYDLSFTNTEIGSSCIQNSTTLALACNVSEADLINTATPVPEPSTMLLFGLGLVGLGVWGRKRFHN